MENSKKRHLSGTVLAGAFAVPAAMSTAQQNVTSANLFTSLYSTASSFFTEKAGESTLNFLVSRIGTCIGVAVVVVGLYKLYKYSLSIGEEKKEGNISEKKEIIEGKNKLDDGQVKKILESVLKEKEKYIKEVIEEKVKKILGPDKVSEETVSKIYSELDLKKFKEANLNLESVTKEDEEENAKKVAVKILKDKIKEVYGKDIENKMSEKIQAVYRGFIVRKKQKEQQIKKVYDENKEFLENFRIKSKQADEFLVDLKKEEGAKKEEVAKKEEEANFVEVSAKVENNTVKVTFKKDKEEKTLNIEKSNEGLKKLEKFVELSKEFMKKTILALYTCGDAQLLKKFEIKKEKVSEFVNFDENINNEKVQVTSERNNDEVIFTFTNGNEKKTLGIQVTKEGYNKLKELIKLARDYHEKKEVVKKEVVKKEVVKKEEVKKEEVKKDEVKKDEVQNNENLEKNNIKDEKSEIFNMFKDKFCKKFENLKDDTNGYLYITKTEGNVIEVKYFGGNRFWPTKYPLSISYDKGKKEFNLKYEWTWACGALSTQKNEMIEKASDAIKGFLEQFSTMYKSATGKDLIFDYNEEEKNIIIYDNSRLKDSTEINNSANYDVDNN